MDILKQTEDERWMSIALDLAEATAGLASPNPQVGCVLVREGVVLGHGAHLYAARDHAEIAALKQAGSEVEGATAYVTLEPCSHHGRTGPCADALIAARIAECVVATVDPNPAVSGRGIARIRAAGIVVRIGPGQAPARAMNDAFALSITEGRPFVTLKAGLSVDGRLAPLPSQRTKTEPFWLTGPAARADVQLLRHSSDAILTGIGTVLADDPQLTDRSGLLRRRPLLRVVLDSMLQIPLRCRLVTKPEEDLWVICAPHAPVERAAALESLGVRVIRAVGSHPQPAEVLHLLHEAKLTSVLLEAGTALNGAFLNAGMVDQAILYYAPTELGPQSLGFAAGAESPFTLEQRMLQIVKRQLGEDVRVSGLLRDPWRKTPVID